MIANLIYFIILYLMITDKKIIKENLPSLAKEYLKDILDDNGEVIYSSHQTIKKGDLYLMGLNPGGNGFITIDNHIDLMLTRDKNSFNDEIFRNRRDKEPKKGEGFLQKNVKWILKSLGYETKNVLATNLIFKTTNSAKALDFRLADQCWKFHQDLLKIIQPKLILVFGNSNGKSPYSYLKKTYGGYDHNEISSGHGNWKCRSFKTKINNRETCIIGLPHLSIYKPEGKLDIDWIKKEALLP